MCIEIESLGYVFSFTLSALGDKDKPDFVMYIIGENRIWQLTPQEKNHSDYIKHVNVLFLQIQVFVIGSSEVDS